MGKSSMVFCNLKTEMNEKEYRVVGYATEIDTSMIRIFVCFLPKNIQFWYFEFENMFLEI